MRGMRERWHPRNGAQTLRLVAYDKIGGSEPVCRRSGRSLCAHVGRESINHALIDKVRHERG